MVPGQGALEYRDVVDAQRQPRILLGRTEWGDRLAVMRLERLLHCRAPRGIEEDERDCRNRRALPGRPCGDLLAIDEGALALVREAQPPAEAVVDPARMRFPARGHRQQYAEGRLPLREI